MDDDLVDAEGFPRSDIDVYQVRHARSNIRCKGNDLSDLLKRIEQGLHSLHSQARKTAMDSESEAARTAEEAEAPFARVMVVVNGSPADKAGIKQ